MDKKITRAFLFLLFCFVIMGFSSCASTRFESVEETIKLKGNPTAGYNWFYQISDDTVIAVEESVKYLGDDLVVGAPSMFTYTITSLKPGQATLHFEYKRPWETVEPAETKEYIITVAENGKIKIEE